MTTRRSRKTKSTEPTSGSLRAALEPLSREALIDVVVNLAAALDEASMERLSEDVRRSAKPRRATRAAQVVVHRDPSLEADTERFVSAHEAEGYAQPKDVDRLLSRIGRAFAAGQHLVVRRCMDRLLPPLENLEIDLGQAELIEEVLESSLDEVVGRYLVSVYLTTVPSERAKAVYDALLAARVLSMTHEPLGLMEAVWPDLLAGFEAFLPRWVALLRRRAPSDPFGDARHLLREAEER